MQMQIQCGFILLAIYAGVRFDRLLFQSANSHMLLHTAQQARDKQLSFDTGDEHNHAHRMPQR